MNQEKTITKILGLNIRRFRRSKGWSQMFLAAEAGLDKSFIGGVERGEFNPSVRKVARIADALEIKIVELFQKAR